MSRFACKYAKTTRFAGQLQSRYGKPGHKETAELPKNASVDTQMQHEKNQNKDNSSLQTYRYGWRLMFIGAGDVLKKAFVPIEGSYDPKNVHAGKIPGWYHEVSPFDHVSA